MLRKSTCGKQSCLENLLTVSRVLGGVQGSVFKPSLHQCSLTNELALTKKKKRFLESHDVLARAGISELEMASGTLNGPVALMALDFPFRGFLL